jgi:aminoglycoside phosphotransferase (APT) family kinase protein
VVDATDAQRERLETASVEVLVGLHDIEDDESTTAFLRAGAPGPTALARQFESQRRYYEWANEGEAVPLVEQAFDVLGATMPGTRRSVLNWGDSRIGNIIFRDFEPVAVIDWEMASVGPREVDLGWMLFIHRFEQWLAGFLDAPGLPDMFERHRVVATYEQLSGERIEDLVWYEAFAALRFAIISIRQSFRNVAFGLQPPPAKPDERIMGRPVLKNLLEELDR